MKGEKQRIVEMTDELASKIKVLRLTDVPIEKGGFQRRLDTKRVSNIAAGVKKQEHVVIPPIVLAENGNGYVLIDGQHRLEAWKRVKFPLYAQISKMTEDEITRNFVVINGTSRRVSLKHRLDIDTGITAMKIRSIATLFDIPKNYVYHMLCGVTRKELVQDAFVDPSALSVEDYEMVGRILREWSKDKRFHSESQVHGKPAVLRLITMMAKTKEKPEAFLRSLQGLNFQKNSPLGRMYGLTNNRTKEMNGYINQWLVDNIK